MLLGTLMHRLEDEAEAGEILISLGDLSLIARVEHAGVPHDEAPGAYAAGAARRFARLASDEDWLGLMNVLERNDNPAEACLRTMIDWSITRDAKEAAHNGDHAAHSGCSCGGGCADG